MKRERKDDDSLSIRLLLCLQKWLKYYTHVYLSLMSVIAMCNSSKCKMRVKRQLHNIEKQEQRKTGIILQKNRGFQY